jgi:hypothetical protein
VQEATLPSDLKAMEAQSRREAEQEIARMKAEAEQDALLQVNSTCLYIHFAVKVERLKGY